MNKEELMKKANSLSEIHNEKKSLVISILDDMDLKIESKQFIDENYYYEISETVNSILNEIYKIEEEYANIIDEIKNKN